MAAPSRDTARPAPAAALRRPCPGRPRSGGGARATDRGRALPAVPRQQRAGARTGAARQGAPRFGRRPARPDRRGLRPRCPRASSRDPLPLPPPVRSGRTASPWAWAIGLVVTVLLLAWALHGVDARAVLAHMRHADPLLFAAAIALATATFPLRAVRWRVILRDARGAAVPTGPLWHATAVGFMANNLLPARAGEFARAYLANRQLPVRFTTALASIAVERVFDGLDDGGTAHGGDHGAVVSHAMPRSAGRRCRRSRPGRRRCSPPCSSSPCSSPTAPRRGSGSRGGCCTPCFPRATPRG